MSHVDAAVRAVRSRVALTQDKTVRLLQRLISIPSVTGQEAAIQEFIASQLRTLGMVVDVWEPDLGQLVQHPAFVPTGQDYAGRPNVTATLPGEGGGRSLLLNGHVDVIPPGPDSVWSHSPWSGQLSEGRVYGRGASDMKSGLAAMIMAVTAVRQSGVRLRGDVTLEFTVDEELSGNGTLACVLKGLKADAGICCETSSMHIQPASIGRIWFEVQVLGKPTGIQRQRDGVNAIDKGYEVVKAIAALEHARMVRGSHPLYADTSAALPCAVGTFEAGSYPSAFPDRCVLRGSLATLPGEDSAHVKKEFAAHILRSVSGDQWLREHPPEVRFTGYFAEPSEIPAEHPIVAAVAQAYTRVLGSAPPISGREGAADTRFLNVYGHTPTVIFGPGSTEQMHAANESVSVEDLIRATEILALTVLDWCSVSER
jgi:acetylornithine deacetylase